MPLKSDIVFKMVFGDARYTDIIQAFLAVTLDIPRQEYSSLKIIDPHLERDSVDDKLGILDVRVELKNGILISVEIQIHETPSMPERVTFSTGRNLSRQITPGQEYSKIEKVVTIVISDYDMIKSSEAYHHIFKLYDVERNVLFTDAMEIHVLELQKLPDEPSLGDKEKELLSWLRLIRSEEEEEIEMLATQTAEMGKAVRRLKRISSSEAARMRYEARQLYLMDEMARINAAQAKGRAEGKIETARNLLKMGLDIDQIVVATGLSVDEIRKL